MSRMVDLSKERESSFSRVLKKLGRDGYIKTVSLANQNVPNKVTAATGSKYRVAAIIFVVIVIIGVLLAGYCYIFSSYPAP